MQVSTLSFFSLCNLKSRNTFEPAQLYFHSSHELKVLLNDEESSDEAGPTTHSNKDTVIPFSRCYSQMDLYTPLIRSLVVFCKDHAQFRQTY